MNAQAQKRSIDGFTASSIICSSHHSSWCIVNRWDWRDFICSLEAVMGKNALLKPTVQVCVERVLRFVVVAGCAVVLLGCRVVRCDLVIAIAREDIQVWRKTPIEGEPHSGSQCCCVNWTPSCLEVVHARLRKKCTIHLARHEDLPRKRANARNSEKKCHEASERNN